MSDAPLGIQDVASHSDRNVQFDIDYASLAKEILISPDADLRTQVLIIGLAISLAGVVINFVLTSYNIYLSKSNRKNDLRLSQFNSSTEAPLQVIINDLLLLSTKIDSTCLLTKLKRDAELRNLQDSTYEKCLSMKQLIQKAEGNGFMVKNDLVGQIDAGIEKVLEAFNQIYGKSQTDANVAIGKRTAIKALTDLCTSIEKTLQSEARKIHSRAFWY